MNEQKQQQDPIAMPNKAILAGEWNMLKGKIKQKWARLTDDDMLFIKGNVHELVGRVQKAYGYTKERALDEFEQFKRGLEAKEETNPSEPKSSS